MKISSILCASIVALAALALATDGAFANSNLNSSRSNIYRAINTSDAAAVSACKKDGGTVGRDPDGHDACVTPKPAEKSEK